MQIVELLQRLDEFLEILEASGGFRRFLVLPMGGIAAFLKNHLGQFDVALLGVQRLPVPAVKPRQNLAQRLGPLALDRPRCQRQPRAFQQGNPVWCAP